MDLPLVSVVMPSFNQAAFIGASIASVLQQDYPHIELIVADGGSSDGTLAILEQARASDRRLRFFSRRDNGPAHALNDAMALVRGTTIGWLNSDDLYTANAITRAMTAFARHPDWLLVYGHGQHIDAQGAIQDDYPTLPASTPIVRFEQGCFICQPTLFMQRSARLLLGPLDETLKTSFDFEYWLRAFHAFPERIGFIDAVQAQSRLHDGCITMRMRRTVALEGMQVLARHLGRAPKEWLLSWVDETLRDLQPPAQGQFHGQADWDALQQDFQLAIEQASPWLPPSEKSRLSQMVEQRLHKSRALYGKRE
jgi:glycosyltransferase involved in cell wall biosynthesis